MNDRNSKEDKVETEGFMERYKPEDVQVKIDKTSASVWVGKMCWKKFFFAYDEHARAHARNYAEKMKKHLREPAKAQWFMGERVEVVFKN